MNRNHGFIFAEILVGIFIASVITLALFEVSSKWLSGIKRTQQTHLELKDAFCHAESIHATPTRTGDLFVPKYTKAVTLKNPSLPDFTKVKITSAISGKTILQADMFDENKKPAEDE